MNKEITNLPFRRLFEHFSQLDNVCHEAQGHPDRFMFASAYWEKDDRPYTSFSMSFGDGKDTQDSILRIYPVNEDKMALAYSYGTPKTIHASPETFSLTLPNDQAIDKIGRHVQALSPEFAAFVHSRMEGKTDQPLVRNKEGDTVWRVLKLG